MANAQTDNNRSSALSSSIVRQLLHANDRPKRPIGVRRNNGPPTFNPFPPRPSEEKVLPTIELTDAMKAKLLVMCPIVGPMASTSSNKDALKQCPLIIRELNGLGPGIKRPILPGEPTRGRKYEAGPPKPRTAPRSALPNDEDQGEFDEETSDSDDDTEEYNKRAAAEERRAIERQAMRDMAPPEVARSDSTRDNLAEAHRLRTDTEGRRDFAKSADLYGRMFTKLFPNGVVATLIVEGGHDPKFANPLTAEQIGAVVNEMSKVYSQRTVLLFLKAYSMLEKFDSDAQTGYATGANAPRSKTYNKIDDAIKMFEESEADDLRVAQCRTSDMLHTHILHGYVLFLKHKYDECLEALAKARESNLSDRPLLLCPVVPIATPDKRLSVVTDLLDYFESRVPEMRAIAEVEGKVCCMSSADKQCDPAYDRHTFYGPKLYTPNAPDYVELMCDTDCKFFYHQSCWRNQRKNFPTGDQVLTLSDKQIIVEKFDAKANRQPPLHKCFNYEKCNGIFYKLVRCSLNGMELTSLQTGAELLAAYRMLERKESLKKKEVEQPKAEELPPAQDAGEVRAIAKLKKQYAQLLEKRDHELQAADAKRARFDTNKVDHFEKMEKKRAAIEVMKEANVMIEKSREQLRPIVEQTRGVIKIALAKIQEEVRDACEAQLARLGHYQKALLQIKNDTANIRLNASDRTEISKRLSDVDRHLHTVDSMKAAFAAHDTDRVIDRMTAAQMVGDESALQRMLDGFKLPQLPAVPDVPKCLGRVQQAIIDEMAAREAAKRDEGRAPPRSAIAVEWDQALRRVDEQNIVVQHRRLSTPEKAAVTIVEMEHSSRRLIIAALNVTRTFISRNCSQPPVVFGVPEIAQFLGIMITAFTADTSTGNMLSLMEAAKATVMANMPLPMAQPPPQPQYAPKYTNPTSSTQPPSSFMEQPRPMMATNPASARQAEHTLSSRASMARRPDLSSAASAHSSRYSLQSGGSRRRSTSRHSVASVAMSTMSAMTTGSMLDTQCLVCMEQVLPEEMLEETCPRGCKNMAHNYCMVGWFKTKGRSCPHCHALIPDNHNFPALG